MRFLLIFIYEEEFFMSVIKKRGSVYSNYKNEGRIARICIASVFLLVAAAVFLMDTSLTCGIREGLMGAFKYDMHLPEAGQKAQELFSGRDEQSVSGGADVLASLKKPLKNPTVIKSFEETGREIQLKAGQLLSVYAVSAGKVISVEGETIIIEHADGLESIYGGCASQYVKTGDSVKAGEMLGSLDVQSPVLAFGLKKAGQYVNPEEYVSILGW